MANEEKAKQDHQTVGTGILILQWLTYAFWGWTIFFTSTLASNVLSHYMTKNNDDSSSLYFISAVVLLLPISVVCNWLYSKHEPTKKSGAASLILIIHAVLFAIFSIGALTVVIFSLLQLLINSGDTSSIQIALYSGLVVAALYSILFLRTINPQRPQLLKKYFLASMIVSIGTILVFGFIGPINGALATRDDRLIDNNLYQIQAQIDTYLNRNDKLPDTLNQLEFTGDAKILVDRNLLIYKPNSKPASTKEDVTTHYYQLCAEYKKANTIIDSYASPSMYTDPNMDDDGYSQYQDFNHPAGQYCYKISSVEAEQDSIKR